jgi:hypothetical protein
MTEEINHHAILARVEQIIDLLRTCHVREGWKLDEEGAERTLRYYRHCADGGQDDNHELRAALEFLYCNGQSLDWVICGDPRGMICNAAAQFRRRRPNPDSTKAAAAVPGNPGRAKPGSFTGIASGLIPASSLRTRRNKSYIYRYAGMVGYKWHSPRAGHDDPQKLGV